MRRVGIGLSTLALLGACGSDGDGKLPSARALQEEYAEALRKCDLLTEQGKVQAVPFALDSGNAAVDKCNAACLGTVYDNCEELEGLACDRRLSDRFSACLEECADIEVKCADGRGTYQSDERCDAMAQCADRSDEKGCFIVTGICDDGEQVAGESSAYLDVCDGIRDCEGGEDEEDCPGPFYCANGEAIPAAAMCDGQSFCDDGEDEEDCADQPAADGFECADKTYSLPREYVCDLIAQCNDGSDEEQGCAKLKCDSSASCDHVAPSDVCDGFDDGCDDEVGCDDDSCDTAVDCDGYDDGCGDEIGCDDFDPCDTAIECDGYDDGCSDELFCDDDSDSCEGAVRCDGYDEGCGDEVGCDDEEPDPCDEAVLCDGYDDGCSDEIGCDIDEPDPCDSAVSCDGFDDGCNDEVGCETEP